MKNLTWQNPEQLFVAQVLINKVKSKCCGIKVKIICAADADNTIVSLVEVPKFEKGQLVKVIDGAFKGVIGRVARWQGQQRVGVVVDELVTVVTAYIPSAFLMSI